MVFPSIAAAQTWNLSWSDEFNGAANSAINPANWQYDTGILNVNNEAEYYCAPGSSTPPCVAGTPNAYIDGNGHLIIQAIKINSNVAPYSGSWTSARLNTANNLQSFQYGRLESSMSLPIGPGIWPAYWALGTNITSVGWPTSGEMDFMENVPAASGLGPTVIKSTLHGGNSSSNCYCGGNGLGQSYTFPSNDPNGPDVTTFHAYGAIWSTNMVQFYVDDPTNIFLVRTVNDVPSGLTWDFNHPFFLLLNLAVGGTGSWPGPPDSTTPNPAVMTVDYVRWYQASPVSGPVMAGAPITVKAGSPGSGTINLTSTSGTGRVYLSCTTNAPKASCSINSSDALNQYTVDFSKTATGTATVNVTTTVNAAALFNRNPGAKPALFASLLAACGFLLASFVFVPAKWGRNLQRSLGGAGLMLALVLHPGCGGGSGAPGGGGGGGGGNGTTPGNYSVTVNAYTVSNASGNPDSTASLTLTVN
jgi:beta-glucanase (GH16 family)